MEYRSRLPGEPSLDHPGVPTGRLGHRAGLKTVGGILGPLRWPSIEPDCLAGVGEETISTGLLVDYGISAGRGDPCRSR